MSVPHPPEAVIRAALMHPVPLYVEPGERIGWQADLIVQALTEHGHLASPEAAEEVTVDDVARWLAAESMHPRYVDTTGGDLDRWRKLLESENDVHVAHSAALKAHPRPDRDYEQRLSEARHVLLRHATDAASRRTEGVG